ncbi:hypothetical protein PI124_g18064 [Phytophthora idaei]|nr:hypothetical protein PI125_g21532 [Phytophthora idaei]KAG3131844.1 hypothetical protein PI126_g19889 [Phytophthora idaei]KAG3236931.1 hypothetical protein PI124_g18064 [Phytophthora idaei]
MVQAAHNKQHEVIWWLYRNTRAPGALKSVLVTAVHNGAIVAIVLLEWLRAKYRTHGFDPVSEDENYEVGGEETKEESSDSSEEDENVTGISNYQAENVADG